MFTGVLYKYTYVYIYIHILIENHIAHYLFLIHIIENNNECNSKTKGHTVGHNVKKFGYCVGKSVAKFSEPYGTDKNMLFTLVLDCM